MLDPRKLLRSPSPHASKVKPVLDPPELFDDDGEAEQRVVGYESPGPDLDEVAKRLELEQADLDGIPKERILRAYKRHDEKLAREPEKEAARAERREQRRQMGSALPRPMEFEPPTKRKAKMFRTQSEKQRLVPVDNKPGMLNPYAAEDKAAGAKANYPRVLITTSLLARGIDFSPLVTHLIIPDNSAATRAELDTPEHHAMSTMDLLHRAGRVARGGAPATLVLFDKTASLSNRPTLKVNGRFRGYKLGRLEGAVRSIRPLGIGRDGPATKRALRDQKFSRGAQRKQVKEKKEIGF